MMRRLSLIAAALLMVGTATALPTQANERELATQRVQLSQENLDRQVVLTEKTLHNVQAALAAFYTDNLAWPTSLSGLGTYYQGSFNTPLGTLSGQVTPSAFSLTLSASGVGSERIAMYKTLVGRQGGAFDEGAMEYSLAVPTPASASIVRNMLARSPDMTGNNLNTMLVDLDMGGFSINNIQDINGARLTVNSAQIASALIDQLELDEGQARNFTVSSALSANQFDAVAGSFEQLHATEAQLGELTFTNGQGDNLTVTNLGATVAEFTDLFSDKASLGAADIDSATIRFASVDELNVDRATFADATASVLRVRQIYAADGAAAIDMNSPVNVNALLSVKDIAVSGSIVQQANELAELGHTTAQSLRVRGTADSAGIINEGSLVQHGNAYFHGPTNFNGGLTFTTANGDTIVVGNLDATVADITTLKAEEANLANATINSANIRHASIDEADTSILRVRQIYAANGANAIDIGSPVNVNGLLTTRDITVNGKIAQAANQTASLGYTTAQTLDVSGQLTVGGRATFSNRIDANNGIYAGNKLVVSADGNTLYEGGKALSTLYLGIDAQATDSAKLGGINASNYARYNVAGTWTSLQTFTNDISVNGTLFSTLKSDVDRLKSDVSTLKSNVSTLTSWMTACRNDPSSTTCGLDLAGGGGGGGGSTEYTTTINSPNALGSNSLPSSWTRATITYGTCTASGQNGGSCTPNHNKTLTATNTGQMQTLDTASISTTSCTMTAGLSFISGDWSTEGSYPNLYSCRVSIAKIVYTYTQ